MKRTSEPPQNTIKAYKLCRCKKDRPGELFSEFIAIEDKEKNQREGLSLHEWYDAEVAKGNGEGRVFGESGTYAQRPGFHLCNYPCAAHIGKKENGKMAYRRPNEVWVEVEMAADVDWQPVADGNSVICKNGKVKQWSNCIKDHIPENGYYKFTTNTNADNRVEWYITGALKVTRLLSDAEVAKINSEAGLSDLPRKEGEEFNPEDYGFEPFEDNTPIMKM